MSRELRNIIRELIDKELEEISTSGSAGGYLTPKAFKGKKKKCSCSTQPIQEASYRKFKGKIGETTQKQKIRKALREMRKSVKDLNSLVEFSNKLKEEMGGNSTNWSIVKEQIDIMSNQISEIQTKLKTLYK